MTKSYSFFFFFGSLYVPTTQNEQQNDQNSNGTQKIDVVETVSPWLVSSDVVTASSKPKPTIRKSVITTQL